jgi:hypothetical protein
MESVYVSVSVIVTLWVRKSLCVWRGINTVWTICSDSVQQLFIEAPAALCRLNAGEGLWLHRPNDKATFFFVHSRHTVCMQSCDETGREKKATGTFPQGAVLGVGSFHCASG